MKFNTDLKQRIQLYILEKISNRDSEIIATTVNSFGISKNTVSNYLRELQDNKVIKKVKRNCYELVSNKQEFVLYKNDGQLIEESKIYDSYILPLLNNVSKNVLQIWQYVFSEMTNNVIEHSEATELRIVVKQDYLKTEIILVDNGIGIFNKIKNHLGLTDTEDAICELFKGKLTTDEAHHSGEGIFFSSKILDSFAILSDGKIFTMDEFDNGAVQEDIFMSDLCGTMVSMQLSNFSNKQLMNVFNEFSSVEQGFNKTIIPLRNVFISNPVSRSQAKRVCARLERFEEVTLDFKDVSWAGQGFMHEIFVVFAKYNPAIKIIPINMNDDVSKMLNHVIH